MAAICLAVVSDGPTHRVMADGRIHPYREPDRPANCISMASWRSRRVHDLARDQGLAVIKDRRRPASRPGGHGVGDHLRRGRRTFSRARSIGSTKPTPNGRCAICN